MLDGMSDVNIYSDPYELSTSNLPYNVSSLNSNKLPRELSLFQLRYL